MELQDTVKEINRLIKQLQENSDDFGKLIDSDDIKQGDERATLFAIKNLENLSRVAGMIVDEAEAASRKLR